MSALIVLVWKAAGSVGERVAVAFICLFRLHLKHSAVFWYKSYERDVRTVHVRPRWLFHPGLITRFCESLEIEMTGFRAFSVYLQSPLLIPPDQTPWKISWLLINWLRGKRETERGRGRVRESGERGGGQSSLGLISSTISYPPSNTCTVVSFAS